MTSRAGPGAYREDVTANPVARTLVRAAATPRPRVRGSEAAVRRSDEIVRIAFGIDSDYVPHVGAAIASLVATAPRARMHFMMLQSGVAADERRQIESCAPRAGFDWVEIDEPELLALEGRDHISRATFYRLALPRIVPADVDRILYLDGDLIAVRDISRLWRTDMRGRALAAVHDAWIDAVSFAERWALAPAPGAYFNAGVLLIDLARVRAQGLFAATLEFLVANRPGLAFMDQDALNRTLWGKWHPLDPIWNVQRNMIIPGMARDVPNGLDPRRRPAVVHFTTEHKPWLPGAYNPYAWLYWRNLKRTPFRERVEATYGVDRREQLRLFARWGKRWPFLTE
jgi:lipopolysaccharide biosynthesis glycosyltransferase